MPRRSSLLINESPLQALPSLACLTGINGAIILQQVHYWLVVSEHRIEGYPWIYNSYDKWSEQFKWLKPRAIQKVILLLEKSGYLVTKQFKYKTKNNTKWYRIDYDKLNEDCENFHSDSLKIHSDGEKIHSDGEEIHSHHTKNSQSLRLNFEQTTQETTQKSTTEDIEQIWQETLIHLKDYVSRANFKTWLAETAPASFDGTLFVVSAKSEFVAQHVNENMRSLIEGALTSIVGGQVKFKCQGGK